MVNVSRCTVFAQTTDKDKLPPMVNEPNQAEIDAETARRLREAAQERRDQQKPRNTLVDLLRAGYTNDNPNCFCQCGKFCPKADACIPVRGEIHQPFWTLREVATPRGRGWVGVLYDPQEQRFRVTALRGITYPTPCRAAQEVMIAALQHPEFPIRFDQNQFCKVDLGPVEQGIAQQLYDMGYDLFLRHIAAPDLRHPVMEAGYRAAQAEAEAAISEKDPGFVWLVGIIDPNDANYVPFQMPKEAYTDVRAERDRDDYVGA